MPNDETKSENGSVSDLEAGLAELIKEYSKRLPEQIAEIARLLEQAREAGTDEALDPAKHEVHRLKGTAGSYGFTEISGELEQLERVLKEGTECGALQWFRIAALTTGLMTMAEKVARS